MADFLDILISRGLGDLPTLGPRRASRFEAEIDLPGAMVEEEELREMPAGVAPRPTGGMQKRGTNGTTEGEGAGASSVAERSAHATVEDARASSARPALRGEGVLEVTGRHEAGPRYAEPSPSHGLDADLPSSLTGDANRVADGSAAHPPFADPRVDPPREGIPSVPSSPIETGEIANDRILTRAARDPSIQGRARGDMATPILPEVHAGARAATLDLHGVAEARSPITDEPVRVGRAGEEFVSASREPVTSRSGSANMVPVVTGIAVAEPDPGLAPRRDHTETAPRITVSIGRIEVKATERPEPPRVAPPAAPVSPRLTLSEYLAQSRGGRR